MTHGVRLGRAAPTIVDVAREIGADLIVMGARGRTRMSRVLIGGVAERVVRTAPCPVLTIHGRETTKHETPRARARQPVFKTILVPTDFNEPSERALDYAKALATRFGAALQILHVVREPFPSDSHAYVAEAAAIRERLFTEAERRLHTTLTTIGGLAATGRLREGPPAEQIAEAASDLGADLIVMGTHGRGPLAHLLMGSVAERVIRIAPCAVLTVRALATPGDGEPADRKAVVWK